ncbi:MAG: HAMP domain-containing sensor histidine kinase [Hyphomicrobium sp.]|jgi:signal transduction histidine kinase
MTSGSLRLRLLAGGAVAIISALFIAGLGLTLLFERHLMRSLINDLESDLRLVLAAIEIDPAGHPRLRREPPDPRFAEPLSGLYWQISSTATGLTRSRSLWDSSLSLPGDVLAPSEVHHHRIQGPGGSELIAVERTVLLKVGAQSLPFRIAVAADLKRIAEARRGFTGDLVPALGLLGLVLAAAMWMQIGLGLKPLARVREGISSIRQGRSTLLDGSAPSEVAPLVDEINGLLAAQALDLERARGHAADLAHGLKTPLAALAADVRELGEKGDHELASRIESVGEAMRRHVERELTRARVRGSRHPAAARSTPLRPLVETLIAIQRRTTEGSRLVFEVEFADDALVPMDKADLAEVLGNLIENAARHARARVRIGVLADGRVSVGDDGPGIPKELRATVMTRGKRLDESGDSTGLGLAIVQEVLDSYGRTLVLDESSEGGLIAIF